MLPDNALSSSAVVSGSADPVKQPGPIYDLMDWERAGVALNDPSEGLLVKVWELRVIGHETAQSVVVSAPGVAETVLFTGAKITEASLAFDQNMRPFVAFVEDNVPKIYWYDTTVSAQIFTNLPSDTRTPRCCKDEKRDWHSSVSDIVLAYIRDGNLCVKYQRDRYLVEYVLEEVGEKATLVSVFMNIKYRLQFRVRNATVFNSTAAVISNPYLAEVVTQICLKSGLTQDQFDTRELWEQNISGFKIETDQGLNKNLEALASMFHFDKVESDGKIKFPKRGREIVAWIPYSDLVADDPSALKQTLIEEKDLPKSVSIKHVDPDGEFASNKQTRTRKSNLIKASKEEKIEAEVVLTADQAATAALVKLKTAWHEQQTFDFATTIKHTIVCPCDVVMVENARGEWFRIRIEERNDEGFLIKFKGVQDAGLDVYQTLGIGHSLPAPVPTTPYEIGETRLEVLNIPTLRDQDDELGVYIAVAGIERGWYGCSLMLSSDGGTNFNEIVVIESPATLGNLTSALESEVSAEYPARQFFDVLVNYPLESVEADALLSNANRCVIGLEVLQFQTVELLEMVDELYHYRCSDLVRGRYATLPEEWAIDTRFVLIDTSMAFIQAQQWMLGREIEFKPVSLGLDEDETTVIVYEYDEGVSQREFPVHNVNASRDVSNNVTVSFIGRGRLGIDTAPRNGKYFAGYRIKFSDGFIIDSPLMEVTRASTPGGVSVQVCALNSVTGEGPYSTAIGV